MTDNSKKIILDLCGGTGSWSNPYKEAGYDVQLVSLPNNDVKDFVLLGKPVYGILAAPPCTEFSLYGSTAGTEGNNTARLCKRIF